jgi:hypothetical protein
MLFVNGFKSLSLHLIIMPKELIPYCEREYQETQELKVQGVIYIEWGLDP